MKRFGTAFLLVVPGTLWAADTATTTATGGMLKMMLGLVIVLGVMAFIAWVLKRMMPGMRGQQSVIRVVGGASVGTRERVVVLEVAGRWLVVGVAPGQVTAIADMEAGEALMNQNEYANINDNNNVSGAKFSAWLSKSVAKFSDNQNAK